MEILGKKLKNRYEVYDMNVWIDGKIHTVQVSVVNGKDFSFLRFGAGSHESLDHEVFENLKSMIKEYFLEEN